MKFNANKHPNATDFNSLTFEAKQAIVTAIIRAGAEMWGEECMPAADAGDNRLFVMEQIADWVDKLEEIAMRF